MSLTLINWVSSVLGGAGGRREVLCVVVVAVMVVVATVVVFAGDDDGLFRFAGDISFAQQLFFFVFLLFFSLLLCSDKYQEPRILTSLLCVYFYFSVCSAFQSLALLALLAPL